MTVTPLAQVLQAIAGQPRTPGELSRQLNTTEDVLSGMLRTLHAGGYVQEAHSGVGDCHCGPCALKSLCRNAQSDTPNLSLLRLTPRGESYLRRVQPHPDCSARCPAPGGRIRRA